MYQYLSNFRMYRRNDWFSNTTTHLMQPLNNFKGILKNDSTTFVKE